MTLRLPPASFLWLVAHEIRLAYRSFGATKRWRRVLASIAVIALPCVLGPLLAWSLRHVDASRGQTVAVVSLIAAAMLLLFTSVASVHILRVFGERADLDLLLASPIPPNRILAAKSVGIYAAVALPYLILTTPFVLASAVLGHPGWLGAPVMIGVVAVVATSLAQALSRALFAALGVRLARTVFQIIGGVLGAMLFVVIQAANALPGVRAMLKHIVAQAPSSPFDWPARAAIGGLAPLALLVALAGALAWATTRLSAANLGNTDAPSKTTPARPVEVSFGASASATIVHKELRLLARDPELLSQVLLQLLYLLPVFFLLVTKGSGGITASRIATGCTAIAALLASSLSWLIVCAEDAPDLLQAAPVVPVVIARAKLAAACLPPLSVVVVVAVILAARDPLAAIATLAVSTGAAVSTALLQARFGKSQPRRAFRRRANGSIALTFGELALTGLWAATAGLLITAPKWALIPLPVLGLLLGALAVGRGGVIAFGTRARALKLGNSALL